VAALSWSQPGESIVPWVLEHPAASPAPGWMAQADTAVQRLASLITSVALCARARTHTYTLTHTLTHTHTHARTHIYTPTLQHYICVATYGAVRADRVCDVADRDRVEELLVARPLDKHLTQQRNERSIPSAPARAGGRSPAGDRYSRLGPFVPT
jgi:hypothetical protein